MFKLASTFQKPTDGSNPQRGFPMVGDGSQTSGDYTPAPALSPREPARPTKGSFSWLFPVAGSNPQRGMPEGEANDQRRPYGDLVQQQPYGGVTYIETPYYDRGAAAFVPNFGSLLENPIGAGRVVNYRPQASYGKGGQYEHGTIFWTSQVIPTSVGLQGLETAQGLAEFADQLAVEAMVRVG